MTDLGSGAGAQKEAPRNGAPLHYENKLLLFYDETRFAEFETMLCIL